MERAILQAANSPCTCPARTWFLCKTLCLCITRFLCKIGLCGKDGFEAKTLVLVKPRFEFKPKHMCKPGVLEKAIIFRKFLGNATFREVLRVKRVQRKSQWVKYRI